MYQQEPVESLEVWKSLKGNQEEREERIHKVLLSPFPDIFWYTIE